MKITAYVHPRRTAITPTGVGKHIIHMVRQLAAMPQTDVRLLTSNQELTDGKLDPRSPLHDLPTNGHPFPRAIMEKLWLVFGHPLADRWTGPCDWVYCPAEAFVPVKKSRLAVTIHASYWFEKDLPEYSGKIFWFRRLFEKIVKKADLVATVSEFMKGRLVELFDADPNRIAVVNNGVEDEFYNPKSIVTDSDLGFSGPYIIVVGGLTWIKGAESVMAVAAVLRKSGSDLRIVVIGHTHPKYVDQAKSLPNIVDIGYKPAETASGLMAGSTALLFLSRYESFGIPAAEAMAAGTPAVVSRGGALPEVVGDAGIIVDRDNAEAIADILMALSKDAGLRRRHVEQGKARARNFTWKACAQRLVDAMNRAV